MSSWSSQGSDKPAATRLPDDPRMRISKRKRRVAGLLTMALIVSVAAGAGHGGNNAAVAAAGTDWNGQMLNVPFPKRGCFKAGAPWLQWIEVACKAPRARPFLPSLGPVPQTVGDHSDFSAEVTGLMTSATGSFPSVTGVTSETGQAGGFGEQVPDTYSLQLNTKPFSTPQCAGHPDCLGEQQFVYTNEGTALIQYWLLHYNDSCPAGWGSYSPSASEVYCYTNGDNSVEVPPQPITNLGNLSLTGTANAGGDDSIIMSVSATEYAAANMGSVLGLGSAWSGAEFIIVGDCCASQANFNDGSTIVVRTTVHNGTTNAPACVLAGYTSETNNLTMVETPAITAGPSPRIESKQSNIPGEPGTCARAGGTGDTHLRTFSGLLYDFQASGDFLLARAKDFIVQTRQISGAPTWPNTSINHAIATLMGTTKVAMCAAPPRIVADGRTLTIQEGSRVVLASGVTITRSGNVYLVTDPSGNSVRATMHDPYIDVSVGLGRWPTQVRGLLANSKGNVGLLETRDGAVLPVPLPFQTLYFRYGDSWRVPPPESLLSECGPTQGGGNPTGPFYAGDLNPQLREWASGICRTLGVRPRLLDACTLDVAVFGDPMAAQVYVGMPDPVLAF